MKVSWIKNRNEQLSTKNSQNVDILCKLNTYQQRNSHFQHLDIHKIIYTKY